VSDLNEKDVMAWVTFQAKLLRDGNYEAVDYPFVADALESFRSCQLSLLRHALADLCFCIALHRTRPETEVWCCVQAGDAGVRLGTVLEHSPSLLIQAGEFLDQAWEIALGRVDEMFPGAVVRPQSLGYTINALRSRDFVPELEGRPTLTVVEGSNPRPSGDDG
jgi:hypothetical protein